MTTTSPVVPSRPAPPQPRPIAQIANQLGLRESELEPYGRLKAKVRLDTLDRLRDRPLGRYIVVSAITPTPLGEGKTVTSIGLSQALGAHLGQRVVTCLRQSSLGPTFGIKGGGSGGGACHLLPAEDVNLHLTGDIHAVTAAANLLAAAIDARLYHEQQYADRFTAQTQLPRLDIDPDSISWNRVLDVNDRALRHVRVGVDDPTAREAKFDIAVASEVMAILALATSIADMRQRLGRIVVARSRRGEPITAEHLGVAGAMAVLMRDAIHPNLVQTQEGTPVFIHAGPFGNIAHGNSSIVADQIALRLADYVVTEAGFAADLGLEKFIDIKCRASGLHPHAAVVVATVRALKMHGGGPAVKPGKSLPPEYVEENVGLVERGCANLARHIAIARGFGLPVVVAINRFPTDTAAEIAAVQQAAAGAGALAAVPSSHFADGGAGARALGEAVMHAANQPSSLQLLYPDSFTLEQKIQRIATAVYGAAGVNYSDLARQQLDQFTAMGLARLPICMAKTHLSISHDPQLKCDPRGFTLPIREVRASAGAGFIYPICGDMMTMPGLPSRPGFLGIDLNDDGTIVGLR
jgi:methylenetetrahydrofolate dehydrogenase (NADP+)/methenyltetrahydrofolate cyclohydrolase/formyltetrahydrofolate synthetase/formate--tetrahydrofolate ligase